MTDVPDYFYRPKNSQNWYVRLVPPAHLKAAGATEYRRTTGHADLKAAKPVAANMIATTLNEWQRLERAAKPKPNQSVALTQALITQICVAREHSWNYSDTHERDRGIDDDELAFNERFGEAADTAARSVIAQGLSSTHWADLRDSSIDFAEVMGYLLSEDDPLLPTLVRSFARAERNGQTRIKVLNEGDEPGLPLPPIKPRGQLLSSITEAYEDHLSVAGGDTKHVRTKINAWRLFIEFAKDVEFDAVTPNLIYKFFEHRMAAPSQSWSGKRVKTLGRSTLKEIFAFARSTDRMTSPNPIDLLEVLPAVSRAKEAERKKPRLPFTTAQLNSIFVSAWYNPREVGIFKGKMRTDPAARYWVPLIGLFHGNRVGEAIQLLASDFSMIDGVFSLSFSVEIAKQPEDGEPNGVERAPAEQSFSPFPEGLGKKLKNKSTKRIIPVHPALIELGIGEFVSKCRAKDGANALLFPSSLPNTGGTTPQLGRAYEQAFLRHVRDRLGFGKGYGNHSFRHQIEDRIRKVHINGKYWPPGAFRQYTGRATSSGSESTDHFEKEGSEKTYGNGYAPKDLLKIIEDIDFSDVRLPRPYFEWLTS